MYENDIYNDNTNGNQPENMNDGVNSNPVPMGDTPNRAPEMSPESAPTGAPQNNGAYFDRLDNSQYRTYNSQSQVYREPVPVQKKSKQKKQHPFLKKIAVAACVGIVCGSLAGGSFYGVCRYTGLLDAAKTISQTSSLPGTSEKVEKIEKTEVIPSIKDSNTEANTTQVVSTDVSAVVDQVMPAMVSIVNTMTEETRWFGQTYTRESAASGSGIIVSQTDDELLIVSNHHVVADATKLEVTFIDGKTAEAKIKGMDSDMDLAVISVNLKDLDSDTKKEIAIATLGDSDDLKLGKPVVVIGNALGYGQSVTSGIISGLNRELEMEDGSTGTFIQTNAAVNPGNSGGALLNINGEVIGIVSNKIGGTTVEGMGYAIPISSASPIIADLMERQTRGDKVAEEDMGYMGVSILTVTDEFKAFYGTNIPKGVFVRSVVEGSPADKAGLKYGDYITKVDGEKVSSAEELLEILSYYKVGDEVTITTKRLIEGEYVEQQYTMTLYAKPEE